MLQIQEIDFKTKIEESKIPVVVDFAAEWCPPCRAMLPFLEEIASEMVDKVAFFKVNIDDSPNIASKYNVMSIPTLIMFKNAQQAAVLVGGQSKAKILEWLKANI